MTCIVGLLDPDRKQTIIGADSGGTTGSHIVPRKDPKVFLLKDRILIGFSNSFRMGQVLRYKLNPPLHIKGKQDIMDYMVNDFIDSVRTAFKDSGIMKVDNQEEEGGSFLVAYKDRLFEINSDFQVGENLVPYACLGSGFRFAMGSLHSTEGTPAETRVRMALLAAEEFTTSVCKPFNIMTLSWDKRSYPF